MLAEEGALTFPQLATPLLVATAWAAVLWLLGLVAVASATRGRGVDPGPRPWIWAKSRRRWSTC
jgi:hypothetical protein